MKPKFIQIIIAVLFFTFFGFVQKTFAANVEINIDREFVVGQDVQVEVKETRTVVNNTTDKVITKKNNSEVFTITPLYKDENSAEVLEQMIKTVSVKGEFNEDLDFTVKYEESSAFIEVNYPLDIAARSSYSFIFSYTNSQLASKAGALADVYIQAFSQDFRFSTGNVDYFYKTTLKVPTSLGEENFVVPTPQEKYKEGEFDVYTFSQEQLVGTYVWVQRGKVQYYKFKIAQKIPSTETSNTGNQNEYRMIIPRSHNGVKINQEVFFTNIEPKPKYITTDKDGNLIGVFMIPSHESDEITIEGYATVSVVDVEITNAGNFSDIPLDFDKTYTAAAQYWEVDNSMIQQKALELKEQKESIFEVLNVTYDYIVDSIDYSQVKRFGVNQRQGALKTLNGGAAVCMEYSDLYITLLRAQKIPSRAAFGYGYDSKEPANNQELHQWVQAYVPLQKEWLNIDPTWGENGPSLIGGDMNHFLTHVASENPNEPSTLSGKTYGNRVVFEPVDFTIEVLPSLPNEEMISQSEILGIYQDKDINAFIKSYEQLFYKIAAGVDSLTTTGVDLRNSAQLIFFSIVLAAVLISIFLFTTTVKIIKNIGKSRQTKQSRNQASPIMKID